MKILFSTIILLFTITANCQIEYGVFAGPQATGVRYTINDIKQESSLKIGVNAGFQMKVPFEGRLSFAPSIMYNLRGYKVEFASPTFPPDSSAVDNNTSFHTIELAFLLQHDFNLEPGHFFIRFGPSLDFALFGNEKFNTNMNTTVDRSMKFSFADYGHYLAAAILQFGYEAKNGLFVYAHYNYSLTTMNNADYGAGILNRAAGLSVGKYFKRNKVVSDTKNK
ncbi:MAG TPA: porin family protein [Chitinophagaceae bacterium]|nr:porin family protein [Chitinophagaceae bacterium]